MPIKRGPLRVLVVVEALAQEVLERQDIDRVQPRGDRRLGLGLFIRRHRSLGAGVTPAVRWAVFGRRRRAGPCAGYRLRCPI